MQTAISIQGARQALRPPLSIDDLTGVGRLDVNLILGALGELVYTWEIEQDRLYWGGDIRAVLDVAPDADVGSGKAFQALIQSPGCSRLDAIRATVPRTDGLGTAFHLFYHLKTVDGSVHIEETGHFLTDVLGKPILSYGVLRIVDALGRRQTSSQGTQLLLPRTALIATLESLLVTSADTGMRSSPASRRGQAGKRSTVFMLAGLSDLGHLNRTYGFHAADEVINVVAARLRGALRIGDEMGRYAGNKLGIILKDCSCEELEAAAQRFQAVIRNDAIETYHGAIVASIKLGAVMMPDDAQSIADVLQGAEDALCVAKKHSQADFVRFTADVKRSEQRRSNQRGSDEIIAALNDRRIVLAYQPIACAQSRIVKYHEGLVRLRGTDGHLKMAGDIIPFAERVGLLKHIDMRVIELAVNELARNPMATLSINVDGLSMVDRDWIDMLTGALRSRKVAAYRLIIEITETAMIRDLSSTLTVVHRLHDLGIRVALDDFGAGHTSFRTLRNMPIDIIKIDGTFIRNISTSEDDRFFVSTLVNLARHLKMKTVAEWVCDEDTARILFDMGVQYLQGDLIGATMPVLTTPTLTQCYEAAEPRAMTLRH